VSDVPQVLCFFRSVLAVLLYVKDVCVCSGAELEDFANEVSARLQDGLSENWSQVLLRSLCCFVLWMHKMSCGSLRVGRTEQN
jgi:hypothetical protein